MSFPDGYIARRFSGIKRNLVAFAEEKRQEQVHALRVDIKKLRALLSFLNKIHKKSRRAGKVLGRLFNDAGKLRENHITMDLFKTAAPFAKLPENFIEKDKVLNARFVKKVPGYLETIMKAEKDIRIPRHKPGSKQVRGYFIKQVDKIKALLDDLSDQSKVHSFRIRVKKLMYVYQSLPAELKQNCGINAGYLDKLQIIAGKWHDCHVAVLFLESHKLGTEAQVEKLRQKERRQLNILVRTGTDFKKKLYAGNQKKDINQC